MRDGEEVYWEGQSCNLGCESHEGSKEEEEEEQTQSLANFINSNHNSDTMVKTPVNPEDFAGVFSLRLETLNKDLILSFSAHLKKLRFLSLRNSFNPTVDIILLICLHLKDLTWLYLRGDNITDPLLMKIVRNLKQLIHLQISNCNPYAISPLARGKVKAIGRNLKEVYFG